MTHSIERFDLEAYTGTDPQDHEADTEDSDIISGRDLHHDPWLVPASTDLQALAMEIFEHLEETCPRPARQRSDARERRKAIVENILANVALLVHHHQEGSRLAISADNKALTRYDRNGFPRQVFMQIVREMEECGLVTMQRGMRGRLRTTIEPTPSFRLRVSAPAVQIGRREGAEPIILKASDGRAKPKVLVDYEDTPETNAMRADMDTVNAMLGEADISKEGIASPSPIFLSRRFQIEQKDAPHTFDQHGRLYGGFWLSLDKTQRHLLRVNGEEVIDLDFSAMHPRLAYLHTGLAMPNSDPYDIEGLPRAAAKVAVSALLSRSGPMRRMPKELRLLVGPKWTPDGITRTVAERHPGIAHLFGTGIGLRLMKTESDILVETLVGLFSKGVPALPMHDGLMCPASHEEAARREMARASLSVVGVALPVNRKEIDRPNS